MVQKSGRAFWGPKGARDLLFEFRYADIALGLIVVEGHARIGEEAQGLFGKVVQAAQQIPSVGLLGSAPLAGRGLCRKEALRVVDDRGRSVRDSGAGALADMPCAERAAWVLASQRRSMSGGAKGAWRVSAWKMSSRRG